MKRVNKDVKISNLALICALFSMVVLIIRCSYLALSEEVDGVNLQVLANNRVTKKITKKASRGTIYDNNGNVLAQDVSSYTLIAYLDPKRTTNENNPQHVVDKENTALVLSAILGMEEETVLKYLNKENVYQTEFGSKGKGLNEITKDKIKAAKLPGIDFIETTKRYYPYGDFASYLVGYAKEQEDGSLKGELGVESIYNEELTGVDGYTIYQKDRKGYKIAGTEEYTEEAVDGSEIYLTIDSNVQFFVEKAIDTYSNKYKYEELDIIVAEAKTGKILAYASNPSFDPNVRNIKNYLDGMTAVSFEPGSTMKIFTYMAALEAGVYNGDEIYKSGSFEASDGTIMSDFNKKGWGYITYDKGFVYSSNTAVMNIISKHLNPLYFKNYLLKLGFGSKTGIGGSLESSGQINFKYETEILNASFGQGIKTTPIQYIKALTSIANDGVLLQPYVIDKVVANDGSVIVSNKRKELGTVAKTETVEYIKNLMYRTINDDDGVGNIYRIKGFDLIGKTGTAQIATDGSGYLSGDENVNRSIALMFPKDDPQIIIYAVVKKCNTVNVLSNVVKDVVKNISKYYNIYDLDKNNAENVNYLVDNYINKNVDEVSKKLKDNNLNVLVIGNGKQIINQYPKNIVVNNEDKVFLVTNSNEYLMPDLKNYSKNEVMTFCNLLELNCVINGNGYVKNQSIKSGEIVNKDSILEINLNLLYTNK